MSSLPPPPQHKTRAVGVSFSPDGRLLAAMGADRKVRVFHFLTGRLHRVFDEALEIFTEQQQVRGGGGGGHVLAHTSTIACGATQSTMCMYSDPLPLLLAMVDVLV